MCLYATTKQPKVAKKNITCYRNNPGIVRGKVASGYNFTYTLEVMEISKLDNRSGNIEAGLHSYKNDRRHNRLRCTIPKGARYYEGSQNGGERGYASSILIIHKPKRKKRKK